MTSNPHQDAERVLANLNASERLPEAIRQAFQYNELKLQQYCQTSPLAIALKSAIEAVKHNRQAMILALTAGIAAEQLQGTLEAIDRLESLCRSIGDEIEEETGFGVQVYEYLRQEEEQAVIKLYQDGHEFRCELQSDSIGALTNFPDATTTASSAKEALLLFAKFLVEAEATASEQSAEAIEDEDLG